MIATCIAIALSLALPPENCLQAESGWASRYSAGVMEATVKVRQEVLHDLPHYVNRYDGFVATEDCSYIGKVVLIRPSPKSRWYQMLVADCARRDNGDGTRSWMQENNILLELDYPTAQAWRGLGGGIEIEVIFGCASLCNQMSKHTPHRPQVQQFVVHQEKLPYRAHIPLTFVQANRTLQTVTGKHVVMCEESP